MRFGNLLLSIVHLVLSLFVLALGMMLIAFFYTEGLRTFMMTVLYERPSVLLLFGIAAVVFGAVLLAGFYFMNSKRYYQVKMGVSRTSIDQSIIQDYVSQYWQELFPGHECHVEVVLHPKQRLELITQIPDSEKEDENLFARIQNELGILLARKLGYEKEFILTISQE